MSLKHFDSLSLRNLFAVNSNDKQNYTMMKELPIDSADAGLV